MSVLSLHNKSNGFWTKNFHSFFDIDKNTMSVRNSNYTSNCYVENGVVGFWLRGYFHPYIPEVQESYRAWLLFKGMDKMELECAKK